MSAIFKCFQVGLLLAQDNPETPRTLSNWPHDHPNLATAMAISLIVAIAVVLIVKRWNGPAPAQTSDDVRHLIVRSVLYSAIWGTVGIAVSAIIFPGSAAQNVLTIVLPVFGTWIGTLLAYYFGKDNYESAAKNSASLAKALTGTDRLRGIPVTQPGIMIPLSGIQLPPSFTDKTRDQRAAVTLKTLATEMTEERLPLIDPTSQEAYGIVHKSLITAFLVKHGEKKADGTDFSLKDLLDDPDAGKFAKESFGLVLNTATLADVKQRMAEKSTPDAPCEDVFVTDADGKKVLGWITDNIVTANALPYTSNNTPA